MFVVDRADLTQPCQRQRQRAVERDAAGDEAGVATLGYDRDAGSSTRRQRRGHLCGAAGADHRRRVTAEASRPVDDIAGNDFGVDENVRCADDVDELFVELWVERRRSHRRTSCRERTGATRSLWGMKWRKWTKWMQWALYETRTNPHRSRCAVHDTVDNPAGHVDLAEFLRITGGFRVVP